MRWADLAGTSGRLAISAFLGIWLLAVGFLAIRGADWIFPLFAMLVFGIGISAIGWWLTMGQTPPPSAIPNPARESKALLIYLLVYGLLFVGVGLGMVKESVAAGPAQEWLVILYKLLIHIVLPLGVLIAVGGTVGPLFSGASFGWRQALLLLVMAGLMFGLLAVVSPSIRHIAETGLSLSAALPWIMGAWLWVSIEAGLCEEALFRGLLQTRLAAWTGSPVFAILAVSIVFALSHWPGLYLRGGPGTDGWSTNPIQVAAFTIATLTPLSILFGILWQRTRNLILIALIHGAVDALPYTAEFIGIWR